MICSNFRGRTSISDMIDLPLSIVHELYIIAYERMEAEMKAEEERKKEEAKQESKDPRGRRLEGHIGSRYQLMSAMDELQDIIEEGG